MPHFPFLSLPLQLRNLITDPSRHKLLIFAGPCIEETGELVLQMGSFSLRDFIQVFADKEVRLRPHPGAGRGSQEGREGPGWFLSRMPESGAGGEGMLGEGKQQVTGSPLLSTSIFYLLDENAKAKRTEPTDGTKGLGQLGDKK